MSLWVDASLVAAAVGLHHMVQVCWDAFMRVVCHQRSGPLNAVERSQLTTVGCRPPLLAVKLLRSIPALNLQFSFIRSHFRAGHHPSLLVDPCGEALVFERLASDVVPHRLRLSRCCVAGQTLAWTSSTVLSEQLAFSRL